ncbi:MAG TPA: hypothetical protein ENK18_03500 [Deltaproteobacteria bacterium]|nr:hypothetical protein [Deltaproteobacteria bacterium]
MADPQHTPVLDGFDRTTVALYRAGIGAASVALLALATQQVASHLGVEISGWIPRSLVLIATALAVVDLHLYDKRVRWVIHAAAWTGASLSLVGAGLQQTAGHWVSHAGLGFLFVSLSALALKERFCFRIPGLRAVPLLLALSLIPLLGGWPVPAALLLGGAGLIYGVLAVAKVRMPLHFDIGNKDAYQI